MNNIKIDIVIPSYINHFNCVLGCIKNLSEQTIKPNNIIVCISEINTDQKEYLLNEINKINFNFNVIINDINIKNNASQNRNRGIKYCLKYTKPDYIMFCDSAGTNLYTKPSVKICHGHPIVKLTLCNAVKYNESMTYGEDGDFCQRINKKYGNVYCYDNKLMKYIK